MLSQTIGYPTFLPREDSEWLVTLFTPHNPVGLVTLREGPGSHRSSAGILTRWSQFEISWFIESVFLGFYVKWAVYFLTCFVHL